MMNMNSSESNAATSDPTSEGQIIRQHKFYIHSSWLAVQSSYFRSLFFSETKESTSAKEVHVQISESEEQAHLMLLEAMYKIDTVDNARLSELLVVLKLAHQYNVKFVFKKCKYRLQSVMLSPEICEKILCFIKVNDTITDVEDLEKMLQSFLAKEFSPLDKTWQTKRFEQLSEATLKCLLSSDELVAASENTVFHALMHWIKQRGIDKVLESTELPSLLSVVRFELIPIDYLYNMVQHNALAKKFPDFNKHYLRGITYHALSNLSKPRSCQSVNRKASTKLFIPYTWVIATDELDKHAQSGKLLKSDHFWYCGYRMVLVINRIVKFKDLGRNKAAFIATLSLAVTNLTEQSEVTIRWQATSQSFPLTPAEKTSTFTKKVHLSSVDIKYRAGTAATPGSTSSTPPSIPSGGFSFGPPQSTVTTSTGTATTSIFMFSTSPSTPSGGFTFGSPQITVSTGTGTATTSGFVSSTPPSKPNGGLSFGSLQSSVTTSAGTASPLFMSSASPSKPNRGLTFGSLQSSVTTSTGTTTPPLFMSSPSKPNGGLTFGSLQSSVTTSSRTATTPLFMSSPSKPSGGLNFGSLQTSVTTSAGTATTPLFMSSTSPSKPCGGLRFSFPQSTVSTSAGTATMPGLMSSTSPSKSSGGLTFGSLQSSVTTSSGTATTPLFMSSPSKSSGGLTFGSLQSGFVSSTPPSKPNGGMSFGSLQSSVTTSAGAASPLFMFSTSPSKPNRGLTFGSLQSSVTTSAGTATTPLFMSSTSPSKPSGGLRFSFPQSTVSTSAGTTTMPGLMSSTSPSKSSGGPTFGSLQSSVTTSSGTATTTGFRFIPSTPPYKQSGLIFDSAKSSVSSKQKSPNPTCLSIDVKISLV